MATVYTTHLDALEKKFKAFLKEARKGENNKSAALRGRKASLEIRQDLKDFKSISTQNDRGEL